MYLYLKNQSRRGKSGNFLRGKEGEEVITEAKSFEYASMMQHGLQSNPGSISDYTVQLLSLSAPPSPYKTLCGPSTSLPHPNLPSISTPQPLAFFQSL